MGTVITLNPPREQVGIKALDLERLKSPIKKKESQPKKQVAEIIYPESDGKPMAENTKQSRWIRKILGGLETQYKAEENIFVAGDLLWYPEEGNNQKSIAPDAMVAFGRKQGDKGCYKQWEENGIAPQVVFEIWSPGNSKAERTGKKFEYESYGVEEYYEYDPDKIILKGWLRKGSKLETIPDIEGWVSPRLGVRFEMKGGELKLFHPNGNEFLTPVEMAEKAETAEFLILIEKQHAEMEKQRAETEKQRAETAERSLLSEQKEKLEALQQAKMEKQRASMAEQRSELLAQKLRELGVEL